VCVCSGEPYYLKATFRKEIEQSAAVVLSPVLHMDKGYEAEEQKLVDMAKKMVLVKEFHVKHTVLHVNSSVHLKLSCLNMAKGRLPILTKQRYLGIILFGRPIMHYSDATWAFRTSRVTWVFNYSSRYAACCKLYCSSQNVLGMDKN